jgi:hypothetical protein
VKTGKEWMKMCRKNSLRGRTMDCTTRKGENEHSKNKGKKIVAIKFKILNIKGKKL